MWTSSRWLTRDANDAVGFRGHAGLRRRVDDRAVDDVRNVVAGDAHFERVRRAAVGAGLLHGLVLAALDVVGRVASPMDDGVGPVLGDHEIDVVLFRGPPSSSPPKISP